jgi:hypothetical protein
MLYPFTVKTINQREDGFWEVQVERQKTLEYDRGDPSNGFYEKPVVIKFQEFYAVKADTDSDALNLVAELVAKNSAERPYDFSKVEVNVVSG